MHAPIAVVHPALVDIVDLGNGHPFFKNRVQEAWALSFMTNCR